MAESAMPSSLGELALVEGVSSSRRGRSVVAVSGKSSRESGLDSWAGGESAFISVRTWTSATVSYREVR